MPLTNSLLNEVTFHAECSTEGDHFQTHNHGQGVYSLGFMVTMKHGVIHVNKKGKKRFLSVLLNDAALKSTQSHLEESALSSCVSVQQLL